MDKLNVAIIGCGRISAAHIDALLQLADLACPVLAVDINEEKARAAAAQLGCEWSTDIETALNSTIDVVHLCLPHDLHAPYAIRAMQAGIHVLTEKPVALTLQQTDEMIRVQRKTGVKLGVIFQTRFIQGVEMLRAMIQDGRFGRILSVRSQLTWHRPYSYYSASEWKGTWEHEGGGVLIDQAIHSIDRVRYILDDDVEWIDGSIHNRCHHDPLPDGRLLQIEDTAEAVIQFKNGCIYTLYASDNYKADAPITIEILGERGRCGLLQDMGFYELDGCYTEIRHTHGTTNIGPGYWGTSHVVQIRDFYEAVLNDGPVAVDAADARKTLEIVKGVYLSSMKNERIYLPFEDTVYQGMGLLRR